MLPGTVRLPTRTAAVVVSDPEKPFDVASVRLPGFPERGAAQSLMPGVDIVDVMLDVRPGEPGQYNRLRIYTPPGAHRPGTLPCVLMAPAGTDLIRGSHLEPDMNQPERIPYVRAGFAVVAFELDGEHS
jgi:hypothetical protein